MKLKPVHIVIVVVAVVAALLLYGGLRAKPGPGETPALAPTAPKPESPAQPEAAPRPETPATEAPGTDKFLEAVRDAANRAESAVGETGQLPPATADLSMAPRIEVEPASELDLGTIARDKVTTGEIKVRNAGKTTLNIARVSTSCGCTKPHIEDAAKVVPPGGVSTVQVTVDPKLLHATFESRKTVTIYTDDPVHSQTRIDIIAKVDPEFLVDPEKVDFGDVAKGTDAEKTVLLRQLQEEPFELKNVDAPVRGPSPEIEFAKRPESEWAAPGKVEYDIRIRLPKDLTPGPLMTWVVLQTNCPRLPAYRLALQANVTSFYKLNPARQLMVRGDPTPGQNSAARTTVTADRPFEIANLTATTSDIQAVVEDGQQPNSRVIAVTAKPDITAGHQEAEVVFDIVADGQSLRERIPVHIWGRSPAKQVPSAALPTPKRLSRPGVSPLAPPLPLAPVPPVAAPPSPAAVSETPPAAPDASAAAPSAATQSPEESAAATKDVSQ